MGLAISPTKLTYARSQGEREKKYKNLHEQSSHYSLQWQDNKTLQGTRNVKKLVPAQTAIRTHPMSVRID